MKIEQLLRDVYEDKLRPEEAEEMIQEASRNEGSVFAHSPSLKIKVRVKEADSKNINLNFSVPLWLFNSLGRLGMGIGSMALRSGKARDEMQAKGVDPDMIAGLLDSGIITDLIEYMKDNAPVDIVDVDTLDGNEKVVVKLSIE